MIQALADARYDDNVGVIILTGAGDKAFCSGGDQKVRGDYGGYKDDSGVHHLNVLDVRSVPVRNRLSRWWLATPSAAVTFCT